MTSQADNKSAIQQALDKFQHLGDPVCDAFLDQFIQNSQKPAGELLEFLFSKSSLTPKDREWLTEAENKKLEIFLNEFQPPENFDREKIALGESFFRRHSFISLVLLGCASLPACYCWNYEAKILAKTGRLTNNVARRLPETAQMLIDVMSEGGLNVFTPGQRSRGLLQVIKVRLIHGCIRWKLSHTNFQKHRNQITHNQLAADSQIDQHHDYEPSDEPSLPAINQEQLLATLLTFSFVILKGLKDMGVKVDPRDEEGYIYCWQVVGSLLGIDKELLKFADSYQNSEILYQVIMERNCTASQEGKRLVTALQEYMANNIENVAPILSKLGAKRWPKIVMYLVADKKCAEAVGIRCNPFEKLWALTLWIGLQLFGRLKNFGLTHNLAERLFIMLSKHIWDWRVEKPFKVEATGKQVFSQSAQELLPKSGEQPALPASLTN